ncbi:M48 family metalloprotease [Rickettsiaceae bacterium]|nr:M48 family metalloprotease [Rickettsiaceae bacterium]
MFSLNFMTLLRAFIIFFIFCSNTAFASIIKDSEIEEVINEVIEPIKKISRLKDLKIYIINDPIPNAFTIGGNAVFINSGLIIDFPDPDILRGIVAHEIGHIAGHHVIRQQEVIKNYQRAAFGATLLGLATAMASKPEGGSAVMMAGQHMSERSVYAYSRTFESSADQTAMSLLERSSHSTVGLIYFFEKMKTFSKSHMVNPYDQTHPMDSDRLSILRNFNKTSKFKESQNSDDLIDRYAIASAKLAAFTLDINKILDRIYDEDNWVIEHYVKAIKNFRIGNFDDALNHVNHLIMKYPDNPYYHELKAQIYFEFGKNSALNEYNIALSYRPNDILIRLERAIVGLTQTINNPRAITRYYQDLLMVVQKDPDNLLALYYLSIFFEKKGLIGKSYLNTALIAFKSGRMDDAKNLADAAIKNLQKKSPEWYKASDLITLIEIEDKENSRK